MSTSRRYTGKTRNRLDKTSRKSDKTISQMGPLATFPDPGGSQPTPIFSDQYPVFDDDKEVWPTRHAEEHPIVEKIRQFALQYRIQSAAHFDIYIDVHQTTQSTYAGKPTHLTWYFKIEILFHDFNDRELYRVCRVKCHKRSRKVREVSINTVQVCEPVGWVSLHDFLKVNFPVLQDPPVKPWVMHAWWRENGKTFGWAELPTELKERIIHFCMCQSHRSSREYGNVKMQAAFRRLNRSYEVTNKLGSWSALLCVSRQVRAITLRLCFVGSSDPEFGKGLCVSAHSHSGLKDSMKRLGRCYQMVEPNGIPVDDKTFSLAKAYQSFPQIYPELNRFATFRHGIRKIRLSMDFLGYLHFFKVTVGGFKRHWREYFLDYEVFQQLPHLKELIIVLPHAAGRMEDKPAQPGPHLFFDQDYACPRALQRIIYEQAAKLLAPYDNVQLYGFIDEDEKHRFKKLRRTAIKELQFKPKDFEELYADNKGGGIELENSVVPGLPIQEADKPTDVKVQYDAEDDFWPPKCRCPVRCRLLVLEKSMRQ